MPVCQATRRAGEPPVEERAHRLGDVRGRVRVRVGGVRVCVRVDASGWTSAAADGGARGPRPGSNGWHRVFVFVVFVVMAVEVRGDDARGSFLLPGQRLRRGAFERGELVALVAEDRRRGRRRGRRFGRGDGDGWVGMMASRGGRGRIGRGEEDGQLAVAARAVIVDVRLDTRYELR